MDTPVHLRLSESNRRVKHWKRWGPYVSERAWGTVREDYSEFGTAWDYFPHDHARSRAYRWNEDGIAGICDRHQFICFAISMWNGRDPILKERFFGLSGSEGNHGEDVKECYYYLDNTPTHCYMRMLYKYPQLEFPYEELVRVNRNRTKLEPELDLQDTGIFDENRYFDVFVEYAKGDVEDMLVRIQVINRGPDPADLRLLPTLWFRNTWDWGDKNIAKPSIKLGAAPAGNLFEIDEPNYGKRYLYGEGLSEPLFTENETNAERLFSYPNMTPFVKDGIHEYVVNGNAHAVNPLLQGTKAALNYVLSLAPGATQTIRLRFTNQLQEAPFSSQFDEIFEQRIKEADAFYETIIPETLSDDAKLVMRQGLAGMLWSKQFYHYDVRRWQQGDSTQPIPPANRKNGRNREWTHLYNSDVISMPDKWEYPWYAAWDLAFHTIPLALVDSDFAKEQLLLMLREWYMHPNGQIPAYEWAFSDVNPPVHAWAALRVYQIEKKRTGVGDRGFLERVYIKLLLNFTWWVNRKDEFGRNVFQGGFLGMDNVGVVDRSAPLPDGGHIEQSDGTSWMAMYCLNMLAISMELAKEEPTYEDTASKFWEHFCYIANAMNHRGGDEITLWDENSGFFYDVLQLPDRPPIRMEVRSMVGLIPLLAVTTLEPDMMEDLPGFTRRLEWFVANRPDLTRNMACMVTSGDQERLLLALVDENQLRAVLSYMLNEHEFLSDYGIRSMSKAYEHHRYRLMIGDMDYSVGYEPAESEGEMFGGNSNWRGPIWFPTNYLIIESLQKFHQYYGDSFTVECPTGSGNYMTLWEVATELSRRLSRIFLRDREGKRAVFADDERYQTDPNWKDLVLFYEYFNGNTGAGLGASHQTGWTGLVAKLLQQSGEGGPDPAPGPVLAVKLHLCSPTPPCTIPGSKASTK